MTTPTHRAISIRDLGATGDGRAKDTAAIQRAIDACATAQGGVVYCPPGTGTFLRADGACTGIHVSDNELSEIEQMQS